MALPTGTVTFLFTDIEGSTRLLQKLGDTYADVLADCRRVIRTAVEERGGQEVDTEGDAVFAAFAGEVRMPPDIRYAKSDGMRIAYEVLENGPIDLVYVSGGGVGFRSIL